MTETRKPAPVQRDGQAPTNRKEKQMQDNNTSETFDEARARLERIMRDHDRDMTPLWDLKNTFEGVSAGIVMPVHWQHPRARLLPSGLAKFMTVCRPTAAEAMSALADLADEASQTRGVA